MSRRIGRDFHVSDRMKSLIEAAGFVDVQETKYKLPLGPWSAEPKYKEIGKFYERFYKTGLQGWLLHTLTTGMGVSYNLIHSIRFRLIESSTNPNKSTKSV